MDKIVIEVSENRVSAVWSSNPELQVEVLDWDICEFDAKMGALEFDDDAYAEKIRGLYLLENRVK